MSPESAKGSENQIPEIAEGIQDMARAAVEACLACEREDGKHAVFAHAARHEDPSSKTYYIIPGKPIRINAKNVGHGKAE